MSKNAKKLSIHFRYGVSPLSDISQAAWKHHETYRCLHPRAIGPIGCLPSHCCLSSSSPPISSKPMPHFTASHCQGKLQLQYKSFTDLKLVDWCWLVDHLDHFGSILLATIRAAIDRWLSTIPWKTSKSTYHNTKGTNPILAFRFGMIWSSLPFRPLLYL